LAMAKLLSRSALAYAPSPGDGGVRYLVDVL
jgi:hypothetical protein